MAISNGDDDSSGSCASSCSACGAGLGADQRYCLACGERRGPLPAAVAEWLSIVPPESAVADEGEFAGVAATAGAEDEDPLRRYMPEPRTAAVAVMALLAFGVLLGAATGPAAQSAGIAPIVLYTSAEPAPAAVEPEEEQASEPLEPVASAAAPLVEEPLPTEPLPEEPLPTSTPAPGKPPFELPEEEVLPPISHVFLIVLGDNGYEGAYGESSRAPYLAETLRKKGELLSNYYAVTEGDLANEIALISGQGPTPATAANCPESTDVAPGTLSPTGQVEGDGCVYPAEAETLPAELTTVKKTWKAYLGEPSQPWRNPFAFFHSPIDEPACDSCVTGLEQLTLDLKEETSTPSFSYIAPGACEDGSQEPCEPERSAGLATAQPFLETVVPEIEESDAYKKGGLIAITFAQAPQTGPEPDTSACCSTPEYPNLPAAVIPPPVTNTPVKETGGGGQVGMLLLSPYVEPNSSNETAYYNHFSFLLSVEELLGVAPLGYAAEPGLTAFDSTVFNLGE